MEKNEAYLVNQTKMRHDIKIMGAKVYTNMTKGRERDDADVVPVVLEHKCFSNYPKIISGMKRYFIKCHKHAMTGHIKKFIATKFLDGDFEKVKHKIHDIYYFCLYYTFIMFLGRTFV